jgi:hypothetical protein
MGTSPRIEVAWRKTEPARVGRYLSVLALLGIAHGMIVGIGTAWMNLDRAVHVTVPPPIPTCFLVPAAWLIGWLGRGRIAAVRGAGLPLLTFLLTLIGAWLTCTLMVAVAAVGALFQGEWLMAPVLLVFSWLAGAWFAALGGWVFFPVGFAATWLAILALRLAAGGTTDRFPRRTRALLA